MHESNGWGSSIAEETWAEDEGKEPEDNDQHDLDDSHKDEKDDIDRDWELEGVDQVEIGKGFIIHVQVIDGFVNTLCICDIVFHIYCDISQFLNILSLLIVEYIDFHNGWESLSLNIWVECNW